MARVGFIGLGNMGGPMAANLLHAEHEVSGFDPVAERMKELAEAGGHPSGSIAQTVRNAEIVITMLPHGPAVRNVYQSEDGILSAAADNTLLLDCSTIDVETA